MAIAKVLLGMVTSIARDLLLGPFAEWAFWRIGEEVVKSSRTTLDDETWARMKRAREKAKKKREEQG